MDIFIYIIFIAVIGWLFRFYSKSPYEKIFLCSIDGISIIKDDRVVDCNDSLLNLFGYENKKKFLNIHPLKLSPAYQPDGEFSLEKADKMFSHAKEHGHITFDWVFLDIASEEKWIEISIIKSSHFGKIIYFMLWKNINQRKHIEHELKVLNANLENIIDEKSKELIDKEHMLFIQSKQAQMGEMISMIAHQWRQPLASISASVIELRMKMYFKKADKTNELDNPFLEYVDTQLQEIEDFTQSLTHTIDDFRNFYKPQASKLTIQINEPIKKAYNIVKGSLSSSGIQVVTKYESEKSIDCYESELIHIFLNLFSNAQEHFEELNLPVREIFITSKDTNDGVEVLFCDNGGGIEGENIDKIFSAYFTTKQSGIGTGLGLYMSRKILKEHHHGDITVTNNDLGACFRVEIKG